MMITRLMHWLQACRVRVYSVCMSATFGAGSQGRVFGAPLDADAAAWSPGRVRLAKSWAVHFHSL